MKKLRIGVIDLATKAPTKALYARVMHANLASIMPQILATWLEEDGHQVEFVCFTGLENLVEELPEGLDLVFIGAFTQSALLAYSLSNLFRSRGAVTVLGGPHARCYPEDALQYFDYVLGFTDRALVRQVVADCSPHRPAGVFLTADEQPKELPGVKQRWKFIEPTLKKAPFIKIVPMIGSLGCPYTCSFCIDALVPYQPLSFEVLKEDLRFLLDKYEHPRVAWHDPNFGIRFDDYMNAIEEVVPPGRMDFIAESSLSVLSEPHLKRLQKNGFKAVLPGIESWYDLGGKSKTGATTGMAKVKQVSDHLNTVLKYIPYVQANFVVGLDADAGDEPFELTRRFLDMTPGVFPGYSLLSAFGRASPLNLEYQQTGRVIGFPFPFLDNNGAMNVKPLHYSWTDFYDRMIDLCRYSFSWKSIAKRFQVNGSNISGWMNVVRAVSSEGFGRTQYHTEIRRRLDHDPEFRPYFEQESNALPEFYRRRIQQELGPLWTWLPDGAMTHDVNAYARAHAASPGTPVASARAAFHGLPSGHGRLKPLAAAAFSPA